MADGAYEFLSLDDLPSCDFVRYILKDTELTLFFVKDNQGEEEEKKPVDPELGDEPTFEEDEDEDHDDHDNLNGHLYKIVFHGVSEFSVKGNEADLYRHKSSLIEKNHIMLEYKGINLNEPETEMKLSFSFALYQIIDLGKIKGPDV